ncbi:hypothetical protein ERJ75_001751700 [Trypanosoma vivax]|uniref:Uncharacterized protein n=1 Tax=Trypanosoma vivax (strain Y486) TaxID=1055687 RepID=G0U2H1_TRYVY|nr:hypothetical protein ERJ75_001751700 [Trypanosoma vivax]CCC50474.1 conserved hypothetical protein [Trypanosoma vivax Y486]
MAKSSRSRWKKAHRRQRAQLLKEAVEQRLDRLNAKLQLAATGGLSEVPHQDPETRFHFVNPAIDPRVPHSGRDGNNNCKEVMCESLDFSKPLKLPPPRTNFYGKSDTSAPHPTARCYEVVSATVPVAGHALSVEDVERMRLEEEQNKKTTAAAGHHVVNEEDSDGATDMKEFVLGCNDAEGETTASTRALISGGFLALSGANAKKAKGASDICASKGAEAKAKRQVSKPMAKLAKSKGDTVKKTGVTRR